MSDGSAIDAGREGVYTHSGISRQKKCILDKAVQCYRNMSVEDIRRNGFNSTGNWARQERHGLERLHQTSSAVFAEYRREDPSEPLRLAGSVLASTRRGPPDHILSRRLGG